MARVGFGTILINYQLKNMWGAKSQDHWLAPTSQLPPSPPFLIDRIPNDKRKAKRTSFIQFFSTQTQFGTKQVWRFSDFNRTKWTKLNCVETGGRHGGGRGEGAMSSNSIPSRPLVEPMKTTRKSKFFQTKIIWDRIALGFDRFALELKKKEKKFQIFKKFQNSSQKIFYLIFFYQRAKQKKRQKNFLIFFL